MTSARIRKKRQRRQQPSAPRAIGANDNRASANDEAVVIRGVILNRKQAADLDEAETKLASRDIHVRRAGRELMNALEAEIEKELANRDRKKRESQVEKIAAAKGLDLRRGTDGTITVTRDGLSTMLSAGAITRAARSAGLKYRADFEKVNSARGLTPPSQDRGRYSAANDAWDRSLKDAQTRVRNTHLRIAGVNLRQGEASAMPALPAGHPTMQSIYVLERVAGEGQNLHDLTASGSVRARLSKALVHALECAAVVYGVSMDHNPLTTGPN